MSFVTIFHDWFTNGENQDLRVKRWIKHQMKISKQATVKGWIRMKPYRVGNPADAIRQKMMFMRQKNRMTDRDFLLAARKRFTPQKFQKIFAWFTRPLELPEKQFLEEDFVGNKTQ